MSLPALQRWWSCIHKPTTRALLLTRLKSDQLLTTRIPIRSTDQLILTRSMKNQLLHKSSTARFFSLYSMKDRLVSKSTTSCSFSSTSTCLLSDKADKYRAKLIRLIDSTGKNLGLMTQEEATVIAKEEGKMLKAIKASNKYDGGESIESGQSNRLFKLVSGAEEERRLKKLEKKRNDEEDLNRLMEENPKKFKLKKPKVKKLMTEMNVRSVIDTADLNRKVKKILELLSKHEDACVRFKIEKWTKNVTSPRVAYEKVIAAAEPGVKVRLGPVNETEDKIIITFFNLKKKDEE